MNCSHQVSSISPAIGTGANFLVTPNFNFSTTHMTLHICRSRSQKISQPRTSLRLSPIILTAHNITIHTTIKRLTGICFPETSVTVSITHFKPEQHGTSICATFKSAMLFRLKISASFDLPEINTTNKQSLTSNPF
jgi:hypothetical protein